MFHNKQKCTQLLLGIYMYLGGHVLSKITIAMVVASVYKLTIHVPLCLNWHDW